MMATRGEAKALVVDPDSSIRAMLSALLLRHGIAVDAAEDYDSAVERSRSNAYAAFVIEPWMDRGEELVDQLARDGGRKPRIIITTTMIAAKEAFLLRDGVAAVFGKPFEVDDVCSAVAALCRCEPAS